MGAVAVAQRLHAIVVFRHNDVPRAIKRYAKGTAELPVPCSLAESLSFEKTTALNV
jgi:hypothetical protein